MSPRLRLAFTAAILLGLAAFLFVRREPTAPSAVPTASAPTPASVAVAPQIENRKSEIKNSAAAPAQSPLADALNAPDGTIRRDLEILNEVFGAFHTNFPRLGNPVGENHEITAALLGENPAQFRFLSRAHRALNARGELCDRWGTPFRFHQISGTAMEIRSAGPDRKFGTPDDALAAACRRAGCFGLRVGPDLRASRVVLLNASPAALPSRGGRA
eukprot:gene61737-84436_t